MSTKLATFGGAFEVDSELLFAPKCSDIPKRVTVESFDDATT